MTFVALKNSARLVGAALIQHTDTRDSPAHLCTMNSGMRIIHGCTGGSVKHEHHMGGIRATMAYRTLSAMLFFRVHWFASPCLLRLVVHQDFELALAHNNHHHHHQSSLCMI